MSGEPFNSEREQAERLDEWIMAAQADGPPENDTVAELRRLVQIGRAIRANETFARQLETRLVQLHHRKRRARQMRWLSAAAALMLVIGLGMVVLNILNPEPRTANPASITTPVALAATSTLAVEIDRTESAILLVSTATATPTPTSTATASLVVAMPTRTPTVTATVTSTPLPSATLLATLPLGTPTPGLSSATLHPTATPAPGISLATPTLALPPSPMPSPAAATLVPAINPTALPGFPPVQLDVLFVADSGAGIAELENGWADLSDQITSLPGQPDFRFGLVTGVQTVDFTGDVGVFQAALQGIEVGRGNSWAALLDEAVTGVSWREGATVRLVIGLTNTHPGDGTRDATQAAAAQGIVVDVIALGGMNEQDASVFQEMAQITGGHLVELDSSGYTLNDWIVQLVAEELAALRSG